MAHKQLTYEQRCGIYSYLKLCLTQIQITNLIGVDKSSTSRDLHRNTGMRGYSSKQAQESANLRKHNGRISGLTKEQLVILLSIYVALVKRSATEKGFWQLNSKSSQH